MDWTAKTTETYNNSATALAEYFGSIGARTNDVERGLELLGPSKDIRVLEIGCGDGRDAAEIVPRVSSYIGVDPSDGLLEIARQRLPEVDFVKADAVSFRYPDNIDLIYAFASLLHINRSDMRLALEKASRCLRSGGIYYLSLKERNQYAEEVKSDQHGERMFYYYSVPIIEGLADEWFDVVCEDHQQIGPTDWFTVVLRRR